MKTGGDAPDWIVSDTFLVRHRILFAFAQLQNGSSFSIIRKTCTLFSDSIHHLLGLQRYPLLQPLKIFSDVFGWLGLAWACAILN